MAASMFAQDYIITIDDNIAINVKKYSVKNNGDKVCVYVNKDDVITDKFKGYNINICLK